MKLKVGEVVEFKNYEGLDLDENLSIPKDKFPEFGKVTKVSDPDEEVTFFMIEGNTCIFSEKSVSKVVSHKDNTLKSEVKNAPVLKIEDFRFCGYDYRVDIKGDNTFGYLSLGSKDNWIFSFGNTPSKAAISNPVWYEGYTLNELKDELKFELANFYIRFGLHNCKYEL